MSDKECQCADCQGIFKKMKAEKPNWTPETRAIINELWSRVEHAETDCVYWKQKYTGTGVFGEKERANYERQVETFIKRIHALETYHGLVEGALV